MNTAVNCNTVEIEEEKYLCYALEESKLIYGWTHGHTLSIELLCYKIEHQRFF